MTFYAAVVIITILIMVMMLVHVMTSNVLNLRVRRSFVAGFAMIIGVTALDWLVIGMGDQVSFPHGVRALLVGVEFTIAPMIVYMLVLAIGNMERVRYLAPLFFVNAILELTSGSTGLIFYVTDTNLLVLGPYYLVYVAIYSLGILVMFREAYLFSKRYQNRNALMLYVNLFSLAFGLWANVAYPYIHTAFLSVAICSAMFYLYYMEQIIQSDAMTRLLNRRCFEAQLQNLSPGAVLIVLDVDKFKFINDTYGHDNGDLVLKTIADCLVQTFGKYGYCYRLGGDEFGVIMKQGLETAEMLTQLHSSLNVCLQAEKGTLPVMPGVSMGYAVYDGISSADEVLKVADQHMYGNKKHRCMQGQD